MLFKQHACFPHRNAASRTVPLPQGYPCLRYAADTTWLQSQELDDFEQYEIAVNRVISGSGIAALCQVRAVCVCL